MEGRLVCGGLVAVEHSGLCSKCRPGADDCYLFGCLGSLAKPVDERLTFDAFTGTSAARNQKNVVRPVLANDVVDNRAWT